MAGWDEMGAGKRAVLGGGVALVILGVAGGIWVVSGPRHGPTGSETAPMLSQAGRQENAQSASQTQGSGATSATGGTAGTAPGTAAQTAQAPAAAGQTGADKAASAKPAPAAPATPAAPASPGVPSFDVVRVSPDGQALVAGRATPGAKIEIEIAGKGVANAQADGAGRFVSMFGLPAADTPRVMRLHATAADGKRTASADEVILAPSTPNSQAAGTGTNAAGGTVASAQSVPEQSASDQTASGIGAKVAEAMGTATTPAPEAAQAASAPAVLLAGKDGVKVLQDGGAASRPPGEVAIGAISYGAKGEVQLSGQGKEGETVRLYLDNKQVATAPVGPGGSWAVSVPDVGQGLYTLRADQVDAAGKVMSRFETPFKREAPALIAATPGQSGTTPQGAAAGTEAGVRAEIITVQPGYTLWGIAKRSYGDGLMYVKVFAANKGQIRDPNLIYPGQVFSVPAQK